jgi:hypothetical protein
MDLLNGFISIFRALDPRCPKPDSRLQGNSDVRAILLTALSLSVALAADAAPILDQQHNFTSSVANSTNGNVAEVGQTFTVGVTGTLDHIDVLMFRVGGPFDPTADPIISIYATSGGLPTGDPLATATTPETQVPLNTADFVTFDLSAAALPVTAGTLMAFAIRTLSDPQPYFLLSDGAAGYAAGAGVNRFPPSAWFAFSPPQDHGFRTFVEPVPEPSSALLIGVGSMAFLACHRRVREQKRSLTA